MILSRNVLHTNNDAKDALAGIRCTITYSAVLEMFFSLNALANPREHPDCGAWAESRFQRLSSSLQEEIMFFSDHYGQWIFATDVVENLIDCELSPECTVYEVSEKLLEMDRIEFAYIFLGFSAFAFDRKKIALWYETPSSVTSEDLGEQTAFLKVTDVIYFFEHTEELRKRLVRVMEAYWEESFREDWKYIEIYDRQNIAKEQIKLQEMGTLDYIRSLHTDIEIQNGQIYFHKDPDFFINIGDVRTVSIHLSVFLGDTLGANIVGSKLFLTRTLSFQSWKATTPVPPELLDIFKACSDETRLKMLKIFWNGHGTTLGLSQILNLTPSTISLHLKQLKNAGLVESNKVNKYVYYSLNREKITSLEQILLNYFEC